MSPRVHIALRGRVTLALAARVRCRPTRQAAYPSQTIRIIVPYAPGGVPDTVARFLGRRLQDRVGQSVVVENRAGGNGSVAAAAITSSPADGYTLMVTDSAHAVGQSAVPQPSSVYNPQKDFVPVALLARAPMFLAVHADVPVTTLQEFIDYVKARPGQVNYGSSGVGSTHHLTMEAMKSALQLQMTHVPYRGTGQSVPALLGGHVQVLFSAYPSLKGAVETNRVKLLANQRRAALAACARCAVAGRGHPGLRPDHADRRLRPRRHAARGGAENRERKPSRS